jgi:hypothetical protein
MVLITNILTAILIQDPTGIVFPKPLEYGAIGALVLWLGWAYVKENKERIANQKEYKDELAKITIDYRTELAKVQSEKDKLYVELSSNKKELEDILEKLKSLKP